jgi:hypothetical protein
MAGTLQSNGGDLLINSLAGNGVPLTFKRAAFAMADADTTLTSAQYSCRTLDITGILTAGRNVVVPLVDGAEWIACNSSTGGFSLTFIGASGTGIAVAAGKSAIVRCDGTDILRVTPDT